METSEASILVAAAAAMVLVAAAEPAVAASKGAETANDVVTTEHVAIRAQIAEAAGPSAEIGAETVVIAALFCLRRS